MYDTARALTLREGRNVARHRPMHMIEVHLSPCHPRGEWLCVIDEVLEATGPDTNTGLMMLMLMGNSNAMLRYAMLCYAMGVVSGKQACLSGDDCAVCCMHQPPFWLAAAPQENGIITHPGHQTSM